MMNTTTMLISIELSMEYNHHQPIHLSVLKDCSLDFFKIYLNLFTKTIELVTFNFNLICKYYSRSIWSLGISINAFLSTFLSIYGLLHDKSQWELHVKNNKFKTDITVGKNLISPSGMSVLNLLFFEWSLTLIEVPKL